MHFKLVSCNTVLSLHTHCDAINHYSEKANHFTMQWYTHTHTKEFSFTLTWRYWNFTKIYSSSLKYQRGGCPGPLVAERVTLPRMFVLQVDRFKSRLRYMEFSLGTPAPPSPPPLCSASMLAIKTTAQPIESVVPWTEVPFGQLINFACLGGHAPSRILRWVVWCLHDSPYLTQYAMKRWFCIL